MIIYKNILAKLTAAGYSSYRLQRDGILSSATINRIRQGQPVTTVTIDLICRLCQCQPGDLLQWVDEKAQG